jgi:hypothetical protein
MHHHLTDIHILVSIFILISTFMLATISTAVTTTSAVWSFSTQDAPSQNCVRVDVAREWVSDHASVVLHDHFRSHENTCTDAAIDVYLTTISTVFIIMCRLPGGFATTSRL